MPKACDLKRGMAVEFNGKLLLIKNIDVQSPSARGAATLYKTRFTDITNGGKVEHNFKGDDVVTLIELSRRPVSFSYQDGDDFIFMDNEDYTQHVFKKDAIEDELLYITESIEGMVILVVNEKAIGLEMPQSVEMEIIETDPSIKGASASARTKPARFATGLTIQVPEYIATGERVKINVAERRFMGRAD